jgi:hypothetical protein
MARGWFALIGVGLAALFVGGLASGATVWVTWLDGVAALLALAALGLVGDPRSPLAAGLLLGLVAAGLLALWLTAVAEGIGGWRLWGTFAAALVAGLIALGAVFAALLEAGPIERLRRRQAG